MSEFEKVQCTCAHGYTCRAMRDPGCCAHSCDYNDVVDALNEVISERDAALAQVDALSIASMAIITSHSAYLQYSGLNPDNLKGGEKSIHDMVSSLESAVMADPSQRLRNVKAEAVTECQLIVARATTTYRDNPGMGFSSTIEDKTAKQLKQELSKDLESYATRVKAGDV